MKKIVWLGLLVSMAACSAPSVDDLVADPALLKKVDERCDRLRADGKNADTAECQNAKAASRQIIKNSASGAINNIKKNSKVLVENIQEKSPGVMEDLGDSAKKAMTNTKNGMEELYENVKSYFND